MSVLHGRTPAYNGSRDANRSRVRPRRLSQVLRMLQRAPSERLSIGNLIESLGDQNFAPLLFLLAIPNIIVVVPGSPFILALPLIVISYQLMTGASFVAMPRYISNRSIRRKLFEAISSRTLPVLRRFERLARPRFWPVGDRWAERIAGFSCLVMSVLLFLPIPFGNAAPALAIALLALGLGVRDGLWFAAGLLVALIVTGIAIGVAYALVMICC